MVIVGDWVGRPVRVGGGVLEGIRVISSTACVVGSISSTVGIAVLADNPPGVSSTDPGTPRGLHPASQINPAIQGRKKPNMMVLRFLDLEFDWLTGIH